MKVINHTTGKISCTEYFPNRKGNLRLWIEGKFISDRDFNKNFSQIDATEQYVKINGQWQPRNKSL